MDGAGSRRKGNSFERFVAKQFSEAFGETLRRVPASGGLDIKCDIYNPEDDTFPYFIECKNRTTYRILSVLDMTSPLFTVFARNEFHAKTSYLNIKYNAKVEPIVVFKGGDFKSPMVMTKINRSRTCYINIYDTHYIYFLHDFLTWCPTKRLGR